MNFSQIFLRVFLPSKPPQQVAMKGNEILQIPGLPPGLIPPGPPPGLPPPPSDDEEEDVVSRFFSLF